MHSKKTKTLNKTQYQRGNKTDGIKISAAYKTESCITQYILHIFSGVSAQSITYLIIVPVETLKGRVNQNYISTRLDYLKGLPDNLFVIFDPFMIKDIDKSYQVKL